MWTQKNKLAKGSQDHQEQWRRIYWNTKKRIWTFKASWTWKYCESLRLYSWWSKRSIDNDHGVCSGSHIGRLYSKNIIRWTKSSNIGLINDFDANL